MRIIWVLYQCLPLVLGAAKIWLHETLCCKSAKVQRCTCYSWKGYYFWCWLTRCHGFIEISPNDHYLALYTYIVEGLNCKRPIRCLASSKILTPHPLTAWRVCIPRLWCGGRTHSHGREGVGGQYFGRRQTLLCTLHIGQFVILRYDKISFCTWKRGK